MSKYKIEKNKYGIFYFLNGKFHREDGPAIEGFDGGKEWWVNDKLHREEGPAVEYASGDKEWWLNHKCYGVDNKFTNESWIKFVKTLIFS